MAATSNSAFLALLENEKTVLRKFLSIDAVPTFSGSWQSLTKVVEAASDDEIPSPALLHFIETYCNVAKKRVFSSIDAEGTMFDLSELDHLEMELDAMAKLGNHFPAVDIDIITEFVDLVCEISCYYVRMLDRKLETFGRKDRPSEEVVRDKVRFLEGLRVSAFRLRYFCLSINDMVSLQDSFSYNNKDHENVLQKIAEKYGLIQVSFKDQSGLRLFVTPKLIENEKILDRFLVSNVDTSNEMGTEMAIICRKFENFTKDTRSFGVDHPLHRLVAIAPNVDVHVINKSSIFLRQIRLELMKSKEFTEAKLGTSGYKLCQHQEIGMFCNYRRSFVCLRDIIIQSQAEICRKITDFLTDITFEDILVMSKYFLLERFDHCTIPAVSFVFQFLMDAMEYSDTVEQVYKDLVDRTFYWLNFAPQWYAQNINRKWFASYMIFHLENLNTIFSQEMFRPHSQWKGALDTFRDNLQLIKATNVTEQEMGFHSYLIDQAKHLLSIWGGSVEASRQTKHYSNSPYERIFQAHDYLIVSSLAGSSYLRCLDLRTRRLVAVKILPKSLQQCAEATRKEIEIIMALKHPNIVQYMDSFETAKETFLVMEYCENKLEIYSGIENPVLIPEEEVRSICRQVLKGLSYLHSNHIVHRDIKPANILKSGTGFVKIADFGDAMIFNDSEVGVKFDMSALSGTPQYMAPECLHQRNVTSSADIWSFGCVFTYLLTTQDPWHSCDNKFNVLYRLGSSNELPVDIESINCSDPAKEILRLIFVRNPSDRPSALALLNLDYFSRVENSII